MAPDLGAPSRPGNGIEVALWARVPLHLDRIGKKSAPVSFSYAWKDTVLYAHGVGARSDELVYLYEGAGPKVLPTFAVVPCFEAVGRLTRDLGVDPGSVVHGEQRTTLHRPIAAAGVLTTVAEVTAIHDKGKGAVVVVHARTTDDRGRPAFDNVFTLFARGQGGFGGDRGPETPRREPPPRAPDFEIVEPTTAEQALLYRLSGDINPLHADPALARAGGFDRPILHGLCTYGFAGRAVLRGACAGDERRLRALSARFAGPVFPGDTLTTRGWHAGDGEWLLTVTTQDGRVVISNAAASVRGSVSTRARDPLSVC